MAPARIQAFVPEPTVEALYDRMLSRFAGLNEVQLHSGSLGPAVHYFGSKLRAVVQNQGLGQGRPRSAVGSSR